MFFYFDFCWRSFLSIKQYGLVMILAAAFAVQFIAIFIVLFFVLPHITVVTPMVDKSNSFIKHRSKCLIEPKLLAES